MADDAKAALLADKKKRIQELKNRKNLRNQQYQLKQQVYFLTSFIPLTEIT